MRPAIFIMAKYDFYTKELRKRIGKINKRLERVEKAGLTSTLIKNFQNEYGDTRIRIDPTKQTLADIIKLEQILHKFEVYTQYSTIGGIKKAQKKRAEKFKERMREKFGDVDQSVIDYAFDSFGDVDLPQLLKEWIYEEVYDMIGEFAMRGMPINTDYLADALKGGMYAALDNMFEDYGYTNVDIHYYDIAINKSFAEAINQIILDRG